MSTEQLSKWPEWMRPLDILTVADAVPYEMMFRPLYSDCVARAGYGEVELPLISSPKYDLTGSLDWEKSLPMGGLSAAQLFITSSNIYHLQRDHPFKVLPVTMEGMYIGFFIPLACQLQDGVNGRYRSFVKYQSPKNREEHLQEVILWLEEEYELERCRLVHQWSSDVFQKYCRRCKRETSSCPAPPQISRNYVPSSC